jgi:hypothetical protein
MVFLTNTLPFATEKAVHSCAQLQIFGTLIDDVPIACGGTQRIVTPEGYKTPLSICDGLAYINMSPPSADDLDRYPHVIFIPNNTWDPLLLNHKHALSPDVYHVDYSHGFQDHGVNDLVWFSFITKPTLSIILCMLMKLLCTAMTLTMKS